jgi:hypothetical protein
MTFLRRWPLPTLAWALVMFSGKAAVAQQVMHSGASTAAESAELEAYRLTIEDARKYFAVQLALARLVRTHPELAEEVGAWDCDLSVPQVTCQAQHKEGSSHAREALRAAGLTSRQFVVIDDVLTEANNYDSGVMCFGDATCAAALAKEAERRHVTANVAVVHQHRAELQRLQGELDAVTSDSVSETAVGQGFVAATAADSAELKAYRLTIEGVRKWYAAALAFARLARTHPESAAADTAEASVTSLTVQARQIEDRPQAREAVRAAGLTAREAVVIVNVLARATFAHMAVLQGMQAQRAAAEAGINPANVAFMNQHQAELQRLAGELEAVAKDSLRRPPR